jgi:regulator of RNase E activity RraA
MASSLRIFSAKLGARGAVVNGYVRDTRAIVKLNFPTFARMDLVDRIPDLATRSTTSGFPSK